MNVPSAKAPRQQAWSHDNLPLLAMLLLCLVYLVAALATLTPVHNWGDDWAQYISHARNLASGRAYTDMDYLFNPAAHIGPRAYPPGFPLLLAPIVAIFGVNIVALKALNTVVLVGAMFLTFLLYRRSLGGWVAFAGAAFFGLHDASWAMRHLIHTEPSYIVWSLGALYCAALPVRGRGIAAAVLCGVLAYLAFATRAIGVSLIAAVALYEILQRGPFSWRFLCIAGLPLAGILLQKHFIAAVDYSAEMGGLSAAVLVRNFVAYYQRTIAIFPLGGRLSLIMPPLIVALTALGVGYRLQAAPAATRPATVHGLRALLQRVPADVWYLGSYTAVLLALPFLQESRYLMPILPLVCAHMAYAVSRLLAPLRHARAAAVAVCLLVLAYYGALHHKHDAPRPDDNALCVDCRATYAFIQQHTPPGSVVAFAKPRALALLTNRRGWVWAPGLDQAANWQEMMQAHVGYIVLVAPDSMLAEKYPPYLSWSGWRSNPRLVLVYENRSFRVLRVS